MPDQDFKLKCALESRKKHFPKKPPSQTFDSVQNKPLDKLTLKKLIVSQYDIWFIQICVFIGNF